MNVYKHRHRKLDPYFQIDGESDKMSKTLDSVTRTTNINNTEMEFNLFR